MTIKRLPVAVWAFYLPGALLIAALAFYFAGGGDLWSERVQRHPQP
jgi:hypothetical protein